MLCVAVWLFLVAMLAVPDALDWRFAVLVIVAPPLATWIFVARPRLIMLANELVVVGVFQTKRYPLRDIVRAEPDSYGTSFWLANGDMFCASTIARPNYAVWFKLRTRAHKVATIILVRAAELRGDPAPDPVAQPRELGDINIPWFTS